MQDSVPFQGEQVLLRAFEPEDKLPLHAFLNHPDLTGNRYLPWRFPNETPMSSKQVEKILEKWEEEEKAVHLAVILRDSQELIGHAFVDWGWDPHCPNLAIVIAPDHQRRGYGSEVLDLLLDHLFESTPAHNVSGWIAEWNQAAREFVQKHGFKESGRWRRDGLRKGAFYDGLLVDILRPEWRQGRQCKLDHGEDRS